MIDDPHLQIAQQSGMTILEYFMDQARDRARRQREAAARQKAKDNAERARETEMDRKAELRREAAQREAASQEERRIAEVELAAKRDREKAAFDENGDITLSGVLDEVCLKYGVTRRELFGKRREKRLSMARLEYYWRCKTETGRSFPEIARYLGNRDHTTAISGVKQYERLRTQIACGEPVSAMYVNYPTLLAMVILDGATAE